MYCNMSSPTRHAMTHEEFAEAALDAMKEEKALGGQVYPSPPESFCVKRVPPLCLKCQVAPSEDLDLDGEVGQPFHQPFLYRKNAWFRGAVLNMRVSMVSNI